jgi:uncharacterized RDD family membrane protein YckC
MAATTLTCPRCSAQGRDTPYCPSCHLYLGDQSGTIERATFTRRFLGDLVLEYVLFFLTFGIGWIIWLAFAAQKSQTPAKQLIHVYILRYSDGRPASGARVALRELLAKHLVFGMLLVVLYPLPQLLNLLWAVWDKKRQTLHDKIADTIVVYAPQGLPTDALAPAKPMVGGRAPVGEVPSPGPSQTAPVSTAWLAADTSAPAPRGASGNAEQVAESLRQLSKMKQEGLITDEESQRKRRELIGRL